MARPGIHVPRGFQYDGRLDGGGFEMAAMLVIRGHYGPIRRFRIQRARRTGDLRSAARLLLRNAAAFDFDEWDGRLLAQVVDVLATAAGLPRDRPDARLDAPARPPADTAPRQRSAP